MLKSLTGVIAGALAFGAVAVQAPTAEAMPIDMAPATLAKTTTVGQVDQVRWVCGPYRCFWRPGYYRPYRYGWGYRGWRRPGWGYYGGPRWHHGWRRW